MSICTLTRNCIISHHSWRHSQILTALGATVVTVANDKTQIQSNEKDRDIKQQIQDIRALEALIHTHTHKHTSAHCVLQMQP